MNVLSKSQLVFLRIAGAILLVVPFIPLELLFGEIKGLGVSFTPLQWVNGVLTTVFISLLLLWLCPEKLRFRFAQAGKSLSASLPRVTPVLPLSLLLVLCFLVSHFAYFHKPHLVDSVVQLFQAKIFSLGMLKAPLPEYPKFFMTQHMIFGEDGWFAQYPPLHSLLLVFGELLSFPWLSQWLFAGASAVLLYLFTKERYDRATAHCMLLLCCFCPFFIFMSASFMNHVSTLFFISAFLFCFQRWEGSASSRYSFLTGLCLAGAFLIRPLTAVAFGVPFAAFAAVQVLRNRSFLSAAIGLLGFFLLALMLPLYNFLTNKDPFLTGYTRLWGKGHDLGFHTSPWGDLHTPLFGLRNELVDLSLLNEYLFESLVPGLLPLALFLLFSRRLERWDFRLALTFLFVPFCYFFYWHRDAFLGPRFLYESLACLLPLLARSLRIGLSELQGKFIGSESFFRRIELSAFASCALCIVVLYMITIGIPQRFTIDATSMHTMKRSIRAEAAATKIKEGLIFVKVSWGNRLLARMRNIGLSASLVENSYRFIDHCLLEELVSSKSDSLPELEAELHKLLDPRMKLLPKAQTHTLNRDTTLKLRPNFTLTPRCRNELRYDQTPYTIYLSALNENSPLLRGNYVVARDLREQNELLRKHYPEKPAYLYNGEAFFPLPARY